MMRNSWILAPALLLTFVPTALADSILLSISTSAVATISSPNDNYYGQYYNVPSLPYFLDYPSACCATSVPFSNISLFVPAGSTITSAVLSIILPTTELQGTGYIVPEGQFKDAEDPSLPSVAPTDGTSGTSEILLGTAVFVPQPTINGDEVSTDIQDLTFTYGGRIEGGFADPGSNWAGYVGGEGQVVIPYTVELDVEYSPVPEPSTIALLGTGLLTAFGVTRRKKK
jgi:PEP-CTERM motif-containing protein